MSTKNSVIKFINSKFFLFQKISNNKNSNKVLWCTARKFKVTKLLIWNCSFHVFSQILKKLGVGEQFCGLWDKFIANKV